MINNHSSPESEKADWRHLYQFTIFSSIKIATALSNLQPIPPIDIPPVSND
jgi:hypothetical protein